MQITIRRVDIGAFRGWIAEHEGKGFFVRQSGEVLSYDEFKKKAGDKHYLASVNGDIDPKLAKKIELNLHKSNIVFDAAAAKKLFEKLKTTNRAIRVPSRTGNGVLEASLNPKGNMVIRETPKDSWCIAYRIEVNPLGAIMGGTVGEKRDGLIQPYEDRKPGYHELGQLITRLLEGPTTA